MEINVPISKENYHKGFLKVVNSFLGLSKSELELVTAMLDNNIKVLTTDARRLLRSKMKTGEMSFNNMVCTLKKSKTLIKTSKGVELNPTMFENVSTKSIKVNFFVT